MKESNGQPKLNVLAKNLFNTELHGWDNLKDAFMDVETEDPTNLWNNYPLDPIQPNTSLYRCDEFTDKHIGKHVLFSGCSVTYGQGLYTSETWSHKLYSKIKNNEDVSGYFNLGTPGRSIFDIIANLFKYFIKYGNPDVIFIDMPDLYRSYFVIDEDGDLETTKDVFSYVRDNTRHGQHALGQHVEEEQLKIFAYHYMLFLEQYCKTNNIQLYCFSYVEPTSEFFNRCNMNRFYTIDNNDLKNQLFKYTKENRDDKFALIARDGKHLGTAFHHVWAETMFDIYEYENKDAK